MDGVKHESGRRKREPWLLAALLAVSATAACKPLETARDVFRYATTPCPFGTEYVVSTDTGTPGLKKFTEKWCETSNAKGDRVRYGPYVELYEKGHKKESGQYAENGTRDGTWTRWYPGGQLMASITYRQGKLAAFTAWHENGMKWEEGGFDKGYKQGRWCRWHSNGQKEIESFFDHGVLDHDYTAWHDNGQKQERGAYDHGTREGKWVQWYPNGQMRSEILFLHGKPEDWYHAWHENGRPMEQALFHGGKPEGTYTIWHDNGQKEEEGSYHDGVLDGKVTAWDRDGKAWLKTEYKGGMLADDAEQAGSPMPNLAEIEPPRSVK